jgi:hypothetical protein
MRMIIAVFALTIGASSAFGEMNEATRRAAYCAGVLDVHIENFKPGNVSDALCGEWREQSYPSLEACIAAREAFRPSKMQEHRERYSSYVAAQAAQGILLHGDNSDDALVAAMVVRNEGRQDAHNTMTKVSIGAIRAQCVNKCRDQEDKCLIDCLGQMEPNGGNVIRCVMLPVELPN